MASNKLGINTLLLTDDLIEKYTADRVIRNKGNINLKKDKVIEPVPGGLYDSNYFGAIYPDRCNCGLVKKVNTYCHNCGSEPLDEATRNSRFARIELPWLFLPYFKKEGLLTFVQETFDVKYDFGTLDEVTGRGKIIKGLELGQVEIIIDKDKQKPILRLHDQYTDISLSSYEGLLNEMNRVGMSSEATEAKRYLDKMVLVTPASVRGIKVTTINGQRQLSLPYTTSVYTSIMMCLEQFREKSDNRKLSEEIILRGVFRAYLRKSLGELSEFTKSSKENLARQMYSARVPNTSRSVITAGPHLKTDEVSFPFQNAYAMMKKDFIEHLMEKLDLPYFRAVETYNKCDASTYKMFEEYLEQRKPVAILVRQPALYKYSMMSFNIKVHKGHDMRLPLEVCSPFGGDFDGDTLASFLVPEEHKEEIMKKMSPINIKYYDKTMKPIIEASHGVIHGYIMCSQIIRDSKKTPKRFETLEDLEKAYNEEKVDLRELVYLDGTATTYGRATMEKIMGATIPEALNLEDPFAEITHKNNGEIFKWMAVQPEAARIAKELREFVLEMSTLEGFTALSLESLKLKLPPGFKEKYEAIQQDASMDSVAKFVRLNTLVKESGKWIEDNMSQDMRDMMLNSNRMKISALLEMALPQMTLTDDKTLLATKNSLYEGMNQEEYATHGMQNRSILSLKQKLVPRSGYLNRQLFYLGQSIEFKEDLFDEKNTGILLPMNRAEGRTLLNGKIVPKSSSTDLVRVRSFVVSKSKYVSRDHLSYKYFLKGETPPSVGLRFMTTLTEQFTQAGLSLKHSGSFISVPEKNNLKLPQDGTYKVNLTEKTVELLDTTGKVSMEFPRPQDFDIINHKVTSKGEIIGVSLIPGTAGIGLDTMIKIMGSRAAMPDEGLSKNNLTLSPCYSPVDGVIKYDYDTKKIMIGTHDMGTILDQAVYYYPNGAKIYKYDKYMSNPLDPAWYLQRDYPTEDVYQMFRKEFIGLAGNLTEELFEVLFRALTKLDPKTGKLEYLGSYRGMTKGSESFFAQMSFERGKNAISKLASGEFKFEDDVFTRNILDFMIMSAKTDVKVKQDVKITKKK